MNVYRKIGVFPAHKKQNYPLAIRVYKKFTNKRLLRDIMNMDKNITKLTKRTGV